MPKDLDLHNIEYVVDGTALPNVTFDVGESYAGLMPISDKANSSEFYFWFFPTENTAADDEILIWLNGGVSPDLIRSFNSTNTDSSIARMLQFRGYTSRKRPFHLAIWNLCSSS